MSCKPKIYPIYPETKAATVIVAAADSKHKDEANYICGPSDCQNKINDAIDAVNAIGGGVVKLLEGTYEISDNIILKANVHLVGTSWGTVIKLENEATLSYAGIVRVKYTTRANNTAVMNLCIDGNRSNQTGLSNKYGIYSEADYLLIKNNYVKNCPRYGLDPHEDSGGNYSKYVFIINNYLENCGNSDGNASSIFLDKCEHSIVANNTIIDSQFHAIGIGTDSRCNVIQGNTVINPSDHGISVNGAIKIDIIGNTITQAGDDGIYLSGSNTTKFINITGNEVSLSQNRGIRLYKTSYNSITNNILINNSQQTNNGYDEIQLDDDGSIYSTYNVVSGNQIRCEETNKARYGIREDAAGDDYNLIRNNVVTGAVTANISSQGVNSSVGDNIAP